MTKVAASKERVLNLFACLIFFLGELLEKSFKNTIRISNSLDSDEADV